MMRVPNRSTIGINVQPDRSPRPDGYYWISISALDAPPKLPKWQGRGGITGRLQRAKWRRVYNAWPDKAGLTVALWSKGEWWLITGQDAAGFRLVAGDPPDIVDLNHLWVVAGPIEPPRAKPPADHGTRE
jgi:hypothetical protein